MATGNVALMHQRQYHLMWRRQKENSIKTSAVLFKSFTGRANPAQIGMSLGGLHSQPSEYKVK